LNRRIVGFLFLLISLSFFAPNLKSQERTAVKQPIAPVRPVTDDYYGTKIVDNYRYMENLKDPEVQAWFKNQNDYTRATLANIPGRDKLLARIKELDQSVPVTVFGVQRLPGDLYFYQKLLAGENISKLYVRKGLKDEERLLVDPNKVEVAASNRSKGKNALAYVDISQDGKYVAVGITPGGSENDRDPCRHVQLDLAQIRRPIGRRHRRRHARRGSLSADVQGRLALQNPSHRRAASRPVFRGSCGPSD